LTPDNIAAASAVIAHLKASFSEQLPV